MLCTLTVAALLGGIADYVLAHNPAFVAFVHRWHDQAPAKFWEEMIIIVALDLCLLAVCLKEAWQS